jgi:hypothetical protein
MAYEPKEGEFILFTNNKGDNPKRPDRRGEMMIGGKLYKLSGWIRESKKDGKPFLSGKCELAQEQPAAPAASDTGALPGASNEPLPF